MRPKILWTLIITLALTTVPGATAGPEHEGKETFGSVAGDPRVIEDAGACYEAALEIDGTACSVLYGHAFNILDKMYINTQRVPDFWGDLARGFQPNAGYEGVWNLNELTLISSPGFVEYVDADTVPPIHHEVGITKTVEIDTAIPIVGYWHLSADYDELAGTDDVAGHGPDAGVLPCLTVRMTLQTGRHVGLGDDLAVGETTKTVISAKAAGEGDDTAAVLPEHACPGGERSAAIVGPEAVTEFQVPLVPLGDEIKIPADKGFIVRVEWYQWAPGEPSNQDKLYQYQWNFHNGPEYLNRVVLPTKTHVWIEGMKALNFDDKLFVQADANSPFGSYDVDPDSVALRLYDEGGKEVAMEHLGQRHLRYSVGHDGHFNPVTATFPWDYKAEGLAPGTYTLEMVARNWQHLADASATTTIVILEDVKKEAIVETDDPTPKDVETKESPSPLMPVLLGLLALIGVAAGRRRR